MTITHKINMDLVRRGIVPRIHTVQGDALTREIEISLFADGIPWQIPGIPKILVRYRRSDRVTGVYDTLPGGIPAGTISGSAVTITVAREVLTAPGDAMLVVTLVDGSRELSTFEFILAVQPNHSQDSVADMEMASVTGMIPAPDHANPGQILVIEEVDEFGLIRRVTAQDNLPGTVISKIELDKANSNDAVSRYLITMDDGSVHSFDINNGKSAYEYAQEGGYTGTEAEFAAKLIEEIPETLSNPYPLTISGQLYDGSEAVDFTQNISDMIENRIPAIPEVLPNPNKLILTGAVSAEYDGSRTVMVEIPAGGSGEPETEMVLSDNLLDKSLMTKGYVFYYGGSGYQMAGDGSGYNYYGFIPLRGAGTYRTKFQQSVHASTGTRIALVNDNNEWMCNVEGVCGEVAEDANWVDFEFVVTQEHISAGATKVAFDVYSLFYDKTMIVKDREYPSEYIPYGYIEVTTDSGKKQDNVLCGKTAVFLGDSICAGTTVGTDSPYYNYGWAGLIGEANHMNWTNYGKNGGTITHRGTDATCIANIADTAIAEHPAADYIIFEGGCNDADQMRKAGLGEISSDYATFDTTTFSGALESLILKLVTAYPYAKIGYIIPQKMYTGYSDYTAANHIHRLYFDRAMEICQKWGIPVVDIWNGSMLNPKLSTSSVYYVEENGQHLTEAGYLAITPMIESWMRNMYVPGIVAGSSGDVTSWNNLTNKPFGSEIAEILPETKLEIDPDSGIAKIPYDLPLSAGGQYTVNYNGTDYSISNGVEITNGFAMGNFGAMIEGASGTEYPFLILSSTDETGTTWGCCPVDGSDSFTLSIQGEVVTKIPEKYAPKQYWAVAVQQDTSAVGYEQITMDTTELADAILHGLPLYLNLKTGTEGSYRLEQLPAIPFISESITTIGFEVENIHDYIVFHQVLGTDKSQLPIALVAMTYRTSTPSQFIVSINVS